MSPALPPVIINADDLGHSSAANAGIAAAFAAGRLSATSLIANMEGFEEGVTLAHEQGFADRVGVHLNLTEGPALTEGIRGLPKLCTPEGELIATNRSLMLLNVAERHAVRTELAAQIARINAAGITPLHADSHRHRHTAWGVLDLVLAVTRDAGIPLVRIANNTAPAGLRQRVYRQLVNGRIWQEGRSVVRWFGSREQIAAKLDRDSGPLEMMVHPTLVEGVILDRMKHGPSDPLLPALAALPLEGRVIGFRALLERVEA